MPLASAPTNANGGDGLGGRGQRRSTRSSSRSSTPKAASATAPSKARPSSSKSRPSSSKARPSSRSSNRGAVSSSSARSDNGENVAPHANSANSNAAAGTSSSRPTNSERRSTQEKPWKKKAATASSASASSSSRGGNGNGGGGIGGGVPSLSEALSFDSNAAVAGGGSSGNATVINNSSSNSKNKGGTTTTTTGSSTKRGRADISATPQKTNSKTSRGKTGTGTSTSGDGSAGGFGINSNQEEGEDEIRTPSPVEQGVTPYWKAVQERGGATSPKLTRSAAKKKAQRFAGAGGGAIGAGGGTGGGGGLLFFSPPDQERNAERERRELEQRENERARRVANARDGGQLLEYDANGNPKFSLDVIRSPPQKKRHADLDPEEDSEDENHFFTDLSPASLCGGKDPPSAPTPAKPMEPMEPTNNVDGNFTNDDGGGGRDYERNLLSEIAELKQMMSHAQASQQGAHDNDEDAANDKAADRAETMAAMQDLIAKNEKNVALCAVYEERTRSLQLTVDQLRGELSNVQTLSGDKERELTSKVESLRKDCEEKAREISVLSQKLEDSAEDKDEEKDVLAKRCSDLETELDETRRSLNEMEWRIGSMENSLQEAKRAKGDLEDRLEESAREKVSLELEKHELQKKIVQTTRDADQKMESRAAELQLVASKSAEAEEKAIHYQGEMERLRKENAKCAALLEKQNAAAFEKQLSGMEQQNSQLVNELDKTKTELQKVEAEANSARKAAEGQKTQFAAKERQLNTAIASLEDKLKNLEAAGAESKAEKEDLKKRLADAEQELASLKAKHAAAKKTIADEMQQSALLSSRLEEFEAMRHELELAQSQIAELERGSNDSTQVIANLQRERSEANQKLTGLKKTYDESKEEAKGLRENNATLEEQKRHLETNLSLLQDDKAGLAKRLETFDEREAELVRKLTVMEEKRRCLHNRVIQLAGNIRVFIRVRPVIASEQDSMQEGKRKHVHQDDESPFHFPGLCDRDLSPTSTSSSSSADDMTKNVVEITEPYKDRGGLSARRKKWRYGFDNVFVPSHGQEEVWEGTEPLVQSAIDGFNVCLFAYGQTGSGKSYTMIGDEQNEGIIYRAVRKLFAAKSDIEKESSGTSTVDISVEMLEIYNEKLRDLLSKDMNEVQIKINSSNEPVVGNILLAASSVDEVFQLLEFAKEKRCVKATNSNAESSRSHLVFTIHFAVKTPNFTREGKLHVCDLAGSERLDKSGSTGTLLKETKAINTSLSCLSNVIESLQGGNAHVPFRDSKLTYLLKDSLGGDSKTLAIVCCNPLPDHFNESLCSIRFAAKASRVELKSASSFSA